MAQAHLLGLGRRVQPLERVLADRVEQAEAAAAPAADEALDDERLELVEVGIADCFRRLEREASPEDGKLPEELLLARVRADHGSTRSSHAAFAAWPEHRETVTRAATAGGRAVRAARPDPGARPVPLPARSREEAHRAADRSHRRLLRVGSAGRPPARARGRAPRHRRRATARLGTGVPNRRAAARGS